MIEIGNIAPTFSAAATNGGGQVSLSDYKGKKVVLYFYPKDDTPGCTTEALEFTARQADFAEANTVILGVSRDSVTKHDKFVSKHDLGITLISDEEGKICESYGVWVEKKNYGKTYMGIERSTFLIGTDGEVEKIWRKVRVKGHVDAVLAALRTT